jgi:hypothetical protein
VSAANGYNWVLELFRFYALSGTLDFGLIGFYRSAFGAVGRAIPTAQDSIAE